MIYFAASKESALAKRNRDYKPWVMCSAQKKRPMKARKSGVSAEMGLVSGLVNVW